MADLNNTPDTDGPVRFKSATSEVGAGVKIILEADNYDDLLTQKAGRFAISKSGIANGCLNGFGQNVYPVNRETGEDISDITGVSGDNVVWQKVFQVSTPL